MDKKLKIFHGSLTIQEKTDAVITKLGHIGKITSGTKTAPKGQVVFFNGNIYDSEANKIWYGDVNLVKDGVRLMEIAMHVGPIYVTREQPFRFEVQTVKSLERAIVMEPGDRLIAVKVTADA